MFPRELLTLGPFTIYTFGLAIALGIIAGLVVATAEARRRGIDVNALTETVLAAAIGGLIGARLLYVLLDLRYYLANPIEILRPDHGGLSFYGGLVLGAVAGGLIARRRGLSFAAAADAAAPGLALGYGIARLGCDLYGKVANVPFAIWADGQPHYPSQLYSALMGFAMFAALWVWRRRTQRDGQLFVLFIGMYAVGRFLVEFTRSGPMIGPLTLTQVVTIPIGIAAFGWLALQAGRRQRQELLGQDTRP